MSSPGECVLTFLGRHELQAYGRAWGQSAQATATPEDADIKPRGGSVVVALYRHKHRHEKCYNPANEFQTLPILHG